MGEFIGDHPKGYLHDLESGQLWEWGGQGNLFLGLTWQVFNSPVPLVGHRSGSDQSLWRSGHSLGLDGEILPALIA